MTLQPGCEQTEGTGGGGGGGGGGKKKKNISKKITSLQVVDTVTDPTIKYCRRRDVPLSFSASGQRRAQVSRRVTPLSRFPERLQQ